MGNVFDQFDNQPPQEQGKVIQQAPVPQQQSSGNVFDQFDNQPPQEQAPIPQNNNNLGIGLGVTGLLGIAAFLASRGKSVEEFSPLLAKLLPGFKNEAEEKMLQGGVENNVLSNNSTYTPPPPNNNTYVDTSPLNFIDKNSPADIRETYAGVKNAQILKSNQLADQIKQIVPDQTEREALTLMRDSRRYNRTPQEVQSGKGHILDNIANDPKYSAQVELAKRPTEAMKQADDLLTKYHDEAGKAGQQYGFLPDELMDPADYSNRIWKQEPPKSPKTEVFKKGLGTTTGHAKARVYNTLVDGILNEKEPATLDAADLLKVYGEEHAKTLTNNKLIKSLVDNGIAEKIQNNKVPKGYVQVGYHQVAIPDYLHHGLRSIVEPNFLNKVKELSALHKYQGIAKTINLSMSLFHDFTIAMQWMYQHTWNPLKAGEYINSLKNVDKITATKEFKGMEEDFVKHTGMTNKLNDNLDILRKIESKNPILQKVLDAPGIKQAIQLNEHHSQFLFDKMQRWMKVMDYAKKVSSWGTKNENATPEQVVRAKRSIAREINAAYGGLNWEAIGMSPTLLGIARLLLLAPDWTISNIELARSAMQKDAGAIVARAHLISALIGGSVLTEGLNKLFTGHFTDQNKKGHLTEIEVRPNIYISLFRGGIGDMLKLTSMVGENGVGGIGRFAQGKLAPIPRMAGAALSGRNYYGQQIQNQGIFVKNTKHTPLNVFQKSGNYLQGVAEAGSPLPFGLQAESRLQGNTDIPSWLLAGSGLARIGNPPKIRKFGSIKE